MASTALNSRILEAMVTSRPDTVTSAASMNGQDTSYIAQYTATLEEFARHNGSLMTGSPSGEDATTEDEEGSFEEGNGGQKRSASSPLDSAKKRRKQSKPNKIGGGSDCSGEGEEIDKDPSLESNEQSEEYSVNESMKETLVPTSTSPLRCPPCDLSTGSNDELRQQMIEQHIGRTLSDEEMLARHAQLARQKMFEQQQQHHHNQQIHYQQKLMNDAIRMQEQQLRERESFLDQEQTKQLERNLLAQKQHSPVTSQPDQSNVYEREEGETGPLNLSNTRWENHSVHSQDPQRSPVTPLPASIPMPPSFPDARFNLPGLLPFGPPHFLLPFMQQNDREPGLSTNNPQNHLNPGQSRIFNLEAFCDLCNKEFCNKYFLKTHKANKHGIFTDEPSCSPMPPTPPTPIGPSTPIGPNTTLMAPLVQSPMTPNSMGGSPYAGAFLAANLGNLPLRPPLPVSLHSNSKPPSSSSKNDSSSVSKTGVINLDAYCELCQKEFCNKYFLKRHKLKIHGVNIEVTIKSPKNNPALDRPDGWCDACRRDIGTKSALNLHKLNVHGPHIVNNVTTTEHSPRHPLDFRQFNPIPLKMDNGEHSTKQNFSPWDMIREKEAIENQASWKENEKKRLSGERSNDDHIDTSQDDHSKVIKENSFHGEKLPPFSLQNMVTAAMPHTEESMLGKDNPSLSSHFNDIRKIKIPHTNGVLESEITSHVKTEQVLSSEGVESNSKENGVENEPAMPVLKPQLESHVEVNASREREINEQKPPQLTKEQLNSQNKREFEESSDPVINTSEPPRTPGGISNSTDDSSREAGIIARVGQPAIVQAPAGTKFTPEQLRQLGVINPDAFCELCCKEFCNKYFLRTHRLKKHNIYTPEYSERSKQQYKETTPINLAKIFEKQNLEYRQPSLNPTELKFDCDSCPRAFPNLYLLHMHKYVFHNLNSGCNAQENIPMAHHMIPNEHLRQLAIQAHHQKIQDHQQIMIRQQKQLQLEETETQQNHIEQQKQKEHYNQKALKDEKSDSESHLIKQSESSIVPSSQQEKELLRPEEAENQVKRESDNSNIKTPKNSPGRVENNSVSPNGESDTSEELRKLQSMILELNRQGEDSIACKVCQKDIGNKYFLRAHMMTEHGILLQDDQPSNSEAAHTPKTPFDVNGRLTSPLNSSGTDSQAYCEICKKDFFSRFILQQHMLTSHGIFAQHPASTSFLDRIRAEVEGRDDRKPQSVSRSFCEICNKELCNKYFMKTHMMKMHGINIENVNSGGVTCDICNKDLCSKYFLKIHRQNTHGLVEDIRDIKDLKESTLKERKDGDDGPEDVISIEVCPLCQRKFKNIKWLRTHLSQDHGEEGKMKWREIESTLPPLDILTGNSSNCSICGQAQPDPVSLHLHIIKYHSSESQSDDQSAEPREQILHCSSCSFVCRSPTLLAAHERSHSPSLPGTPQMSLSSSPLQCHICNQVLPTIETYQQHVLHHQLQGLFEPLISKSNESNDPEHSSERDSNVNTLENGKKESFGRKFKRFWKCRRCNTRYRSKNSCLLHVFVKHPKKKIYSSYILTRLKNRQMYKCRKCGKTESRLGDLINHIRTHLPVTSKQFSGTGAIASKSQPLESDCQQDFVMQRFLMNTMSGSENSNEEAEFIPSLVHLPVCRRVHRPLTISVTLTPA